MSKTFRPFEPDQMFLLPPSLTEWLPKNHLVFFIREALDEMDLRRITIEYEDEERGYPPYHPKMMTGILLYGYCCGITSSRKLAKHLPGRPSGHGSMSITTAFDLTSCHPILRPQPGRTCVELHQQAMHAESLLPRVRRSWRCRHWTIRAVKKAQR